jgi:hypothetical protein
LVDFQLFVQRTSFWEFEVKGKMISPPMRMSVLFWRLSRSKGQAQRTAGAMNPFILFSERPSVALVDGSGRRAKMILLQGLTRKKGQFSVAILLAHVSNQWCGQTRVRKSHLVQFWLRSLEP